MKTMRSGLSRRAIVLLLVAVALLLSVTGVAANTRTGGAGYIPLFARIERGEILHSEEWAAIVFYHETDCPPEDFNLLDGMYDPGLIFCDVNTTDGFFIWAGEPWISAPIQIKLVGLGATPVWFVNWDELQSAVADDVLTIGELEGQSSLMKGSAGIYTETLHPTGAVKVPMIEYVAKGVLEDGQSFFVHALLVVDRTAEVIIKFQ